MNENTLNYNSNHLLQKILLGFFLILVLFYLYIRYVEPNSLTIHEYAIIDDTLPSSYDGLKIVHFSDILYGSTINNTNLDKIITKINELKPDILVFTGDLFNKNININDETATQIKEKFKLLQVNFQKYAIIGDSDYIAKDIYLDILNDSGFTVLENTSNLFYYGENTPLMFIGTSSILEAENNIAASITTDEDTTNYFKIWLNHEPTIYNELLNQDLKPNLILTGHTLGGLIHLPFSKYLLQQNGVENYTNNYYQNENTKMYISFGLGTYKYNVRFKNLPSINLYRLYKD